MVESRDGGDRRYARFPLGSSSLSSSFCARYKTSYRVSAAVRKDRGRALTPVSNSFGFHKIYAGVDREKTYRVGPTELHASRCCRALHVTETSSCGRVSYTHTHVHRALENSSSYTQRNTRDGPFSISSFSTPRMELNLTGRRPALTDESRCESVDSWLKSNTHRVYTTTR